jgi:ribosomal protein RSM22 (predicted rRNA methylase)
MSPLSYPDDLEQWWLRECVRVLKSPDPKKCLDQLLPDVQRLSDLFTVERAPGFGGYADQSHAQLAYGVYFFPQSFVRTLKVLQEVLKRQPSSIPQDRPCRILDLGAGLGAATLAAATALGVDHDAEITAIDQSASGLCILRRIFDEQHSLWPQAVLNTIPGDLNNIPSPTEGSWDLILSSFALNETFPEEDDIPIRPWIQAASNRLEPAGLLVILEPATQTSATRIERLRDWVASEGSAQIMGPCPHHESCPLLQAGHAWCHEVRNWDAPAAMTYLNRKLFRSIDVLKFSFLALHPGRLPAAPAGPEFVRLIAPMCEIKGKIVTSGCAADGKAYTYEILTRSMSRSEKTQLLAMERGDVVQWKGLTPLGDGKTFRAEGIDNP